MNKIITLLCLILLLAVACEREPVPDPTPGDDPVTEMDGLIPNAVTDYDGNVYDGVRIGQQVWMASNLKTKHYANGEDIPWGGTDWSLTKPYLYYPENNPEKVSTYGYLYNWPAAVNRANSSESNPSGTQGVCPDGWHIPSDAEWEQLKNYCANNTEYVCDTFIRSFANALASNIDWKASDRECSPGYDLTSNNATGFNALPAGSSYGSDGYEAIGSDACFWSASGCDGCTYAYYHYLSNTSFSFPRNTSDKDNAYSVRCVKD